MTETIIRSASLEGFAELVEAHGGDPATYCRAAQLPQSALQSREVLISSDAVGQMLELASDDLDCPDLGLRMSAIQTIDGLGPLAIAIRHSATLGEAFSAAQQFLRLHNQGSTVSIEPDPYGVRGVVGLRHIWGLSDSQYGQVLDRGIKNLHNIVSLLAGGEYGLRSVELAHRPRVPLPVYQEQFGGVRVNVGRPQAMLRLPEALLGQPIEGANATLRELAMAHLAAQEPHGDLIETVRVRAALLALLGGGATSVASTAQALEITPRTMQRRLSTEGTTFGVLLDQVRQVRALELLAQPQHTIADVAAMIEFDQATFARTARRWWGLPPSGKRRQLKLR